MRMGWHSATSVRLQCAVLQGAVAALLVHSGAAQTAEGSAGPAEAPNAGNSTSRAFGDGAEEEEEDDSGLPISIGLLVGLCIIGACLCCCCYAIFHACVFYSTYGWMYEWAKWGKDMIFGKKDEGKPGEAGGQAGWDTAPWNSGGGNSNAPSAPWNSGAGGAVVNMLSGSAPWSREVDLPQTADGSAAPAGSTTAAKPVAEP